MIVLAPFYGINAKPIKSDKNEPTMHQMDFVKLRSINIAEYELIYRRISEKNMNIRSI
jgi:hypothetical protein